jgi:hypothetical protein
MRTASAYTDNKIVSRAPKWARREMRLAAQVQARTQQRAAENWLSLYVLVSTHEFNLAGEN